jgi:hypothetical protein
VNKTQQNAIRAEKIHNSCIYRSNKMLSKNREIHTLSEVDYKKTLHVTFYRDDVLKSSLPRCMPTDLGEAAQKVYKKSSPALVVGCSGVSLSVHSLNFLMQVITEKWAQLPAAPIGSWQTGSRPAHKAGEKHSQGGR